MCHRQHTSNLLFDKVRYPRNHSVVTCLHSLETNQNNVNVQNSYRSSRTRSLQHAAKPSHGVVRYSKNKTKTTCSNSVAINHLTPDATTRPMAPIKNILFFGSIAIKALEIKLHVSFGGMTVLQNMKPQNSFRTYWRTLCHAGGIRRAKKSKHWKQKI